VQPLQRDERHERAVLELRFTGISDHHQVISESLSEMLTELNPDALLADGLEAACIGVTVNHHHAHVAVYDVQKCIQILVERDGMTHEGAEEFLEFNTFGAYVGENGPLYVRLK
jgi:hypothetical protein